VVSSGFANSYALTSVMARGNQWEAIFLDDQNREKMLEVLTPLSMPHYRHGLAQRRRPLPLLLRLGRRCHWRGPPDTDKHRWSI